MSVSMDEPVVAKLLVHSFKYWKKEKQELLIKHLITACKDEINNFLEYLEDPENYKCNIKNQKCKIGNKIFIEKKALWTSEIKYLEEKNLIKNDLFIATIVDFIFVGKPDHIVAKYPTRDGLKTSTIYLGYIPELPLL